MLGAGVMTMVLVVIIILFAVLYNLQRKRDQTKLVELNNLNLKSKAISCRALHRRLIAVESDGEDLANFSSEARTRDWLVEQRKVNVCRYCREGRKSKENKRE